MATDNADLILARQTKRGELICFQNLKSSFNCLKDIKLQSGRGEIQFKNTLSLSLRMIILFLYANVGKPWGL